MLVRPVADIASFPAPGWTTSPLFEKVNSVEPDDSTFITGLAPGAQDPQVALQIGDLEIPYGASGQIIVKVRMRWSATLTAAPDTVRIGLAPAANLGVTDPNLTFVRTLAAFSSTDFETIEIVFSYDDWVGDSSAFGIYIEMDPDDADITQFGQIGWIEVDACVPAVVIGQCSLGGVTARDVIMEARDHHPSFEPRAHPNGTLLRLLSSYQREITAKIARINPSLLASEIVATLPLTDFSQGIKIPSHVYVMPSVEVVYGNNDVQTRIPLVNLTMRNEPETADLTAFLRGNRLYLNGREATWSRFSQVRFNAVLTPRDLTTLDDVLVLPDWGRDAYVSALVARMAFRGGLGGEAQALATDMEQKFLDTVAQQKSAETFITIDDFGGW